MYHVVHRHQEVSDSWHPTRTSRFISHLNGHLKNQLAQDLLSDDFRARTQGIQLPSCNPVRQGCHPAIGRTIVAIHELRGSRQGLNDFLRSLDRVGSDVNGPDHHLFAPNEFDQAQRNVGMVTSQRDDINLGFPQFREGLLALPPLGYECFLPIGVGLDAVVIADIHGRFALKPFGGLFHGSDAQVIRLVEEHVDRSLIELNDVDTSDLQFLRFLIKNIRKISNQLSRPF